MNSFFPINEVQLSNEVELKSEVELTNRKMEDINVVPFQTHTHTWLPLRTVFTIKETK